MNILFTGGSSFTGMWFVKELAASGHHVTAIFKRPLEEYSAVRLERVKALMPICQCVFDVKFGDDAFLDLVKSQSHWDLLCHHAADVTDYKSPQFDSKKALDNNTHNIELVMKVLRAHGSAKIVLTGSVFEQREGMGTEPLVAFSPYGLSKGLTYDVFAYYSGIYSITLGKFVIPNPFGPYEEQRFTSYLIDTWMEKKVPQVKTPLYVRDNIPVSLLAKAYHNFAQKVSTTSGFLSTHPSCYVESQGDFALRVADAMKSRLQLPCEVEICHQQSFNEPLERYNSDRIDWAAVKWSETDAWDSLASYYINRKAQTVVGI